MSKIIMHVDLNAFFASAEELRDPSLKGKPLAIGGKGRRSVVSTASYEARKYGVHSAQPIYQAQKCCPNLIIKPVDFHYYQILSNSFFAYLGKFSRLVEPASIDEGYVDMTSYLKDKKDPLKVFREIQEGLLKEIGLPCSIGVGPNKFLAKMASDMKKPLGITILRRKDLPKMMYPLPIKDFFGIGKQSVLHLKERFGIETIKDLKERIDLKDPEIISFFGKSFQSVEKHINGYGDDVVDPSPRDPKSIGRSFTLEEDTNDIEEIFGVFEMMASEIISEMKRYKKASKTLSITFRDPDFLTKSKSVTYKEPIEDELSLLENAKSLYKANFLGRKARLIGLTLENLYDPKEENVQMSFWNYKDYEESDKTKLIISEMNRKMEKKYEKALLMRGSEAKKNGNK